jgi:predicted nucleotidyltransferase
MNTQIYLEKLLGREVDFVDKDCVRSGMSDFIASDMQVIW